MNNPPIRNAFPMLLSALALFPLGACSGSDTAEKTQTSASAANQPPAAPPAAPGAATPPSEVGTAAPAPATTPVASTPASTGSETTPPIAPIANSGGPAPSGSSGTPPSNTPPSEPAGTSNGGAAPAPGVAEFVPLDPALLARCTGTGPISCTLNLPNGNYDVSVEVGDAASAGVSRVSAETRHYAGAAVETAAGAFSRVNFTVNVHAEVHDGGQSAPGNVLNLLIDGAAPKLHGLGVRAAPNAVTVFIASDSTACDWVSTNTSALAPDETGWGQVLSMYLEPGVAVANYADSGETSGSFFGKFFPPARDAMKAGDYLFIQFGHNNKSDADIARYGADLSQYVAAARAKNAIPVIVTPVSRSSATAANPGFNGLDQVARDLAARDNVALIDLSALSRTFYTTVPNKNALFIDGTHFHEDGAIGVAGVVADAIQSSKLALASFVK